MSAIRKKLIGVAMPLAAISTASARERSIRYDLGSAETIVSWTIGSALVNAGGEPS